MTTAADRGWGPGWPTDRRADMVKVSDPTGTAVYVHRGVSQLVAGLMAMTEKMGYLIKTGETWGYAGRYIRGTENSTRVPSNHSWGLAVDLNAPSNPMGDRLITDIPAPVTALWKRFRFRWGGDYSGRKDAMHFEYMGTPAQAAADTQKFFAEFGPVLNNNPLPPGIKPTARPRLNAPIVACAARPQGDGYWLVGADGGVFPFGRAIGYGSLGGTVLNQPIVGAASTKSGNGYWLVAADGGVFPFGDAVGLGSLGNVTLNKPIIGVMAPSDSAAQNGYWLVGSDGGVFPFNLPGFGSVPATLDPAL